MTLLPESVIQGLLKLPWLEIVAKVWQVVRKLWRGLADEGMYEVLAYESCLELKSRNGRSAQFTKREKVKYRQDNIIAYQDHAWGDGEILLDYKCRPGVVADRYRPGQKIFLLISLREVKQRGDVDIFHIEWGIKDGFIRDHELWETEVRHKTRRLKIEFVFPRSRPPQRVWIEEMLQRKRRPLNSTHKTVLPDGRIKVSWQTHHPKLNERYQFHWEW